MRGIRRPEPPDGMADVLDAFRRCAAHVDLAQRAMLRCVPSSARSIALPLPVGAETLRLSLAAAVEEMPSWRHPMIEAEWQLCSRAVDDTLAALDDAVAVAGSTRELEVALTAVQDLLDPLHAFVDAEARLTAMRRTRRSR